jgi:hypothetical protein
MEAMESSLLIVKRCEYWCKTAYVVLSVVSKISAVRQEI